MKSNTILRAVLITLVGLVIGYNSYSQCPPEGTATDPEHKDLNKRKNKSASIPSWTPQKVPLNMLITKSKKNDEKKFFNGAYVFTEGYLISSEEEGPESCNCNKATKAKKNGDVHIYLGLVPNAPKKNCIVIEITPKYKKLHSDYSDNLVKNAHVRVEGYLLFDSEHKGNAANTCESCGNVWRKTCWEIHPVTKLDLIN